MGITADVWADATWPRLAWDRELDEPRIAEAFRALSGTVRAWPAPADFLAALPKRRELNALPPPTLTEDQRAANVRRLFGMVEAIVADSRL